MILCQLIVNCNECGESKYFNLEVLLDVKQWTLVVFFFFQFCDLVFKVVMIGKSI
jgi:hypothetical protein